MSSSPAVQKGDTIETPNDHLRPERAAAARTLWHWLFTQNTRERSPGDQLGRLSNLRLPLLEQVTRFVVLLVQDLAG